MNILKGKIESIIIKNSLSLVKVNVNNNILSAIVIDTPDTAHYLRVNNHIKVIFKETEVIIGKGENHSVSLQNKLKGKIETINTGEILSKLIIDTAAGKIVSIITSNAVNELSLNEGSKVTAMIKTNEIMLSE